MMAAWLSPTPYPEVEAAVPRLKEKYLLAVLIQREPENAPDRSGANRAQAPLPVGDQRR